MTEHEEMLVCSMEECGEMIQELSKMLRRGLPPADTKPLTDEVGDVQTLIGYLIEAGLVNEYALNERMLKKKAKLKKWTSFA